MGIFDALLNNKVNKKIEVSNSTISEASHAIAKNCFSQGISHPRYNEIYNACLDNMYANALYLGYSASDGVDIDIDEYTERGVKMQLDMLYNSNQPKSVSKENLFRYLKEKKFNDMEKFALGIQ